MKKDFIELEGTTVDMALRCGKKFSGIIVGCHYDVGITVVNAEDKDQKILCVNGREKDDFLSEAVGYDYNFYTTVAMLSVGKYDGNQLLNIIDVEDTGSHGSMSSCAFGA